MRYWKVKMGNGYCGCDDNFLTTTEEKELLFEDCLDMYVYSDGAAGIDPDDEEEFDMFYSYEDGIADNSDWEEITEEEYQALIEDDWEVR